MLSAVLFAMSAPVECGVLPRSNPDRVPNAVAVMLERGEFGNGMSVLPLDEHSILVSQPIAGSEGPPSLGLNGSSESFEWVVSAGVAGVVLEDCNMVASALSLSSPPFFEEWVGPDFYSERPAQLIDDADYRSVSFESDALSEAREVYLHVPPCWASGDALIVSGDGLAGSDFSAITQQLANSGRIAPVAFVSARFGQGWLSPNGPDQRSAEYLAPSGEADAGRLEAYENHERFIFEEMLPWAIEELGGEVGDVVMFGLSASATFALDQGMKRPELVDRVIAASPPLSAQSSALAQSAVGGPDIHLWCGQFEPIFCSRIQELGSEFGFDVNIRPASHTNALWEEALAASLVSAMPATSGARQCSRPD